MSEVEGEGVAREEGRAEGGRRDCLATGISCNYLCSHFASAVTVLARFASTDSVLSVLSYEETQCLTWPIPPFPLLLLV